MRRGGVVGVCVWLCDGVRWGKWVVGVNDQSCVRLHAGFFVRCPERHCRFIQF
jgi:hypothetical protein